MHNWAGAKLRDYVPQGPGPKLIVDGHMRGGASIILTTLITCSRTALQLWCRPQAHRRMHDELVGVDLPRREPAPTQRRIQQKDTVSYYK
jgi:hypothetical protein